jgi:hypothetical protein
MAETQLFITHPVENKEEELLSDENQATRLLQNLFELDYICYSRGSLQMTKCGYDYFMRKCNVNDINFEFNVFEDGSIQQMIFHQFFKGKAGVNTVDKFIQNNL